MKIDGLSPMERMAYEQNLYAYRDIKNGLDSAWRIGFEEGFAKGFAKGFAEGKAELRRTVESKMRNMGYSEEQIKAMFGE